MLDLDSYLRRIGYDGPQAPTQATLWAVHAAHIEAVPFENLDIHAGRPIVLDEDALFDKIVRRHRGGFCYELNGLFSVLLTELGFRVTRLSAGVLDDAGVFGPEFDHMTLLVDLENRWLADVGFGDAFWEPLRLDDPHEQTQRGRRFTIAHDGHLGTLHFEYAQGKPEGYRFSFQPRQFVEYESMCHYHQTSPDSPFTRGRFVTKATPTGRITLSETRVIVTERGQRNERLLAEGEWERILQEEFGISRP
ncbi:MAG: arylamine N-acetyltransferase family protein [bacterium]